MKFEILQKLLDTLIYISKSLIKLIPPLKKTLKSLIKSKKNYLVDMLFSFMAGILFMCALIYFNYIHKWTDKNICNPCKWDSEENNIVISEIQRSFSDLKDIFPNIKSNAQIKIKNISDNSYNAFLLASTDFYDDDKSWHIELNSEELMHVDGKSSNKRCDYLMKWIFGGPNQKDIINRDRELKYKMFDTKEYGKCKIWKEAFKRLDPGLDREAFIAVIPRDDGYKDITLLVGDIGYEQPAKIRDAVRELIAPLVYDNKVKIDRIEH